MTALRAYRAHQKAVDRVPETKAALIAALLEERANGKTWQTLANELGLTRQRVYEIVNRRGDPKM